MTAMPSAGRDSAIITPLAERGPPSCQSEPQSAVTPSAVKHLGERLEVTKGYSGSDAAGKLEADVLAPHTI